MWLNFYFHAIKYWEKILKLHTSCIWQSEAIREFGAIYSGITLSEHIYNSPLASGPVLVAHTNFYHIPVAVSFVEFWISSIKNLSRSFSTSISSATFDPEACFSNCNWNNTILLKYMIKEIVHDLAVDTIYNVK